MRTALSIVREACDFDREVSERLMAMINSIRSAMGGVSGTHLGSIGLSTHHDNAQDLHP